MIPAVRRPQRPIPRSGGVDGRRRRWLGGGAWAQAAAGAGAPPERSRGAGHWPGGRHESGGGAGDVHVAEQLGYGVGAHAGELCWSRCASGFAPAVERSALVASLNGG